ncbi:hypothetical protein, partial [Acidovorax sp.]|uniref:hypothetical protein n=1 Tax=Acidovorax sp. TaxID=1872122 RepID=UPI0025C38358
MPAVLKVCFVSDEGHPPTPQNASRSDSIPPTIPAAEAAGSTGDAMANIISHENGEIPHQKLTPVITA